ncbi:FAD-dependent monooxygenase [Kineobactrum salinum]|uniref:FAD-dependent oxidoreductase n=1 Tax=Kineobactrum salinum TaxID=2708301 RepID=A0A6C0TZ02_9GAMM|nr:FAD-dependent monooxygenase [Kineobactrum salinum]QIB65050.1 FAD-dependent oxidoreductase [Kineobactrum salinum]
MTSSQARKILISGASIAGPTLGYWLEKSGFDVTLVERSDAVRAGGYAIDIRGPAVDVVERMGILPPLREAHIRTRKFTFLSPSGRKVGSIKPVDLMGAEEGRDIELPRGHLTSLLYDLTRDKVKYIFGDCICSISDGDSGVDVEFKSGSKERFDVVVAADGLHSATREMVFGPESLFSRYLGFCFAICTLPDLHGLSREAVLYNKPGKLAMLYAAGEAPPLGGVIVVKRPAPTREELEDIEQQREFMASSISGDSNMVSKLIPALVEDEGFYFDTMMQIRMPSWSSGRVAVVGDAAYAPSFFSGQGTSLALVGAYMLAGELARHDNHSEAFQAYERTVRPFVEKNQAVAKDGGETMVPDSALKLWLRNRMIQLAPLLNRFGLISRGPRKAYTALTLPDYEGPQREHS